MGKASNHASATDLSGGDLLHRYSDCSFAALNAGLHDSAVRTHWRHATR